jgi:hypothetical protein
MSDGSGGALTDEQVQQLNDISRAVIDGLDRSSPR